MQPIPDTSRAIVGATVWHLAVLMRDGTWELRCGQRVRDPDARLTLARDVIGTHDLPPCRNCFPVGVMIEESS